MSHDPTVLADGPLSVSVDRYGAGVVIVSLAGELDQSNVSTAREAILSAVEDGDDILVIDLSALTFLDSSGIALLLATDEMCHGRFSLRVVPSRSLAVSRILHATGVDSTLKVVRDRPPTTA